MIPSKENTKKWHISLWSRFIGIFFWTPFILIADNVQENNWSIALIKLCLVILSFIFIIIIPDKIIFGKYLCGKKNKTLNERRENK